MVAQEILLRRGEISGTLCWSYSTRARINTEAFSEAPGATAKELGSVSSRKWYYY